MIQRPLRSPYLTDSRVQTLYFLQRVGRTGDVFSLEDLSTLPTGYSLSSIMRCLPKWRGWLLTPYLLPNGRTFFEGERPDRQFYTCRPISLAADWYPFMGSCFWDRRSVLPPHPEPEVGEREIPPDPVILPPLSLLARVVFCVSVLLLCETIVQVARKQWKMLFLFTRTLTDSQAETRR